MNKQSLKWSLTILVVAAVLTMSFASQGWGLDRALSQTTPGQTIPVMSSMIPSFVCLGGANKPTVFVSGSNFWDITWTRVEWQPVGGTTVEIVPDTISADHDFLSFQIPGDSLTAPVKATVTVINHHDDGTSEAATAPLTFQAAYCISLPAIFNQLLP